MISHSFITRALIGLAVLTKQGVAAHSDHHHDGHDNRRLNQHSCRTEPGDDTGEAEQAFEEWLSLHPCSEESCPFLEEMVSESTVQIDVVWHDIRKDDGSEGVTSSMISGAISALNNAYGSAGFSFSLIQTTSTSNTAYWYCSDDEAEAAMKSELHTGDCATLNIYSLYAGNDLGWATFPYKCGSYADGVAIYTQSLPGGTYAPYNKGGWLIHEVGHWMGVYHLWQGGCSEPGDYVSDTPPQAWADTRCEIGRDTCPGGDGKPDDVTNFMNWGDDNCANHFTTLQFARMHSQWEKYRARPSPTNPPTTPAPVSPTPAPVAPTPPASTGGGSCFSKEATVQVQGQGTTKMTQLKIGDRVLTASGAYQPIYGFAHNDNISKTRFLRIHTAANGEAPLEVTSQHLVFLSWPNTSMTAASLQVGDSIMVNNPTTSNDNLEMTPVTKIETIERLGLFAPLTASGDIVVDGVASSCYISLQPHGDPQYVELQGWFGGTAGTMVSHHFVAHLVMTVPRVACMGFKAELCQTYTDAGVAHFVHVVLDIGNWFFAQTMSVQFVLLTMAIMFLLPLYMLEWMVGPAMTVWLLVTCIMVIVFGQSIGYSLFTKHKTSNKERVK